MYMYYKSKCLYGCIEILTQNVAFAIFLTANCIDEHITAYFSYPQNTYVCISLSVSISIYLYVFVLVACVYIFTLKNVGNQQNNTDRRQKS